MKRALSRSVASVVSRPRQRFIPTPANVPTPDAIDIYTDGSCLNNGKKNAISGIGVYCPTHTSLNVGEVLTAVSVHTNQRAEILAIVRAVESAAILDSSIRIYTDSFYAYKGLTSWVYNWRAQGRMATIKNYDLFSRALDAISESKHNFYITHILGHNGNAGNIAADRLARKAINDLLFNQKSGSPASVS